MRRYKTKAVPCTDTCPACVCVCHRHCVPCVRARVSLFDGGACSSVDARITTWKAGEEGRAPPLEIYGSSRYLFRRTDVRDTTIKKEIACRPLDEPLTTPDSHGPHCDAGQRFTLGPLSYLQHHFVPYCSELCFKRLGSFFFCFVYLAFSFWPEWRGRFRGKSSWEGEAFVYVLLTKSYRPRSERAALLFVSD